jgi:hypothetical protein
LKELFSWAVGPTKFVFLNHAPDTSLLLQMVTPTAAHQRMNWRGDRRTR